MLKNEIVYFFERPFQTAVEGGLLLTLNENFNIEASELSQKSFRI